MSKSKQPVHAGPPAGSGNDRPASSAIASQNAALTGAAKAFINHLPREDLVRYVNGHSSSPSNKPPPKPLVPRSRAGSSESLPFSQSRQDVRPAANRQVSSSTGYVLHAPQIGLGRSNSSQTCNTLDGSKTTSNLAAALAAARASPASSYVSPSHAHTQRPSSAAPPYRMRTGSSSTIASTDRLDETPIPQTSSLVKLYEQNDAAKHEKPKMPSVITSKPATIQSPKPVRKSLLVDTGLTPLFPPNSEQLVHDRLAAKGLLKGQQRDAAEDSDASIESFRSAKEAHSPTRTSKPPMPVPRRKVQQDRGNTVKEPVTRPGIHLQPPSRDASSAAPIDIRHPPSRRDSSAPQSSTSHPSITAAYNQLHPRRLTPLTTGDSLANAIVASNLASSRAPSPHKLPPQPLTRAKASSISHSLFSRTPSPPKRGMRHTMRSSSSSSSGSEDIPFAKHKKKKFLRKHPNKHHEGDRKRWRDALTERERKRYEGLWAANKGVHLFYTKEEQEYLDEHPRGRHVDAIREAASDQVMDVVVRDIWSRSRLTDDVLEQVWDLVDSQANGRLQKEEFVVGLWLIDQCLKGRKLPTKVTESVWNSVKFLQGIKFRKK